MSGIFKKSPCLLWPLTILRRLVVLLLRLVGRLIFVGVGFALLVIGAMISITIIGLVVGFPLMIVGFLLVVRGIF